MPKTKTPRTGRPRGVKERKARKPRKRNIPPPHQRFGNTREAADRIGVGEKTIRANLDKFGHRIGGRNIVDFEKLDGWVASMPGAPAA